MPYAIDRHLPGVTRDEADARTRAARAAAGFGVLTEIDMAATMHRKLGRSMPGYRILGACNRAMAWEAIGVEPRVGAILPCNVILRETEGGVAVRAIDPVASMAAIDNAGLHAVAGQVRDMRGGALAAV
jgi:uncharacterized protein (DUF302 family)